MNYSPMPHTIQSTNIYCANVHVKHYASVPDWILVLGDVAVAGTLLLRLALGVGLGPMLARGLGATGGGLGLVGGGGLTLPPTSSIFSDVFSFFLSLSLSERYHAFPFKRVSCKSTTLR